LCSRPLDLFTALVCTCSVGTANVGISSVGVEMETENRKLNLQRLKLCSKVKWHWDHSYWVCYVQNADSLLIGERLVFCLRIFGM
jgi:hypothetical protein